MITLSDFYLACESKYHVTKTSFVKLLGAGESVHVSRVRREMAFLGFGRSMLRNGP